MNLAEHPTVRHFHESQSERAGLPMFGTHFPVEQFPKE